MYTYEFVPFLTNALPFSENDAYRETVNANAAKGWRFVGTVPRQVLVNGQIAMDLVFEKQA